MARPLSRWAFHEVLRRNLQYLIVDCPHSALAEAYCPEELLPSACVGRSAGIFNALSVNSIIDRLDSVKVADVQSALLQLLHLCSGVGSGRLNTFMSAPAYQHVATLLDAETLLLAIARCLTAVHDDLLESFATDNEMIPIQVKLTGGIAALLHGYIASNQHLEHVCDAIAATEERTHYKVLTCLLKLQHLGCQRPDARLPLGKLCLCIRSLMIICLMGGSAVLLSARDNAPPSASPSSHPSRSASPSARSSNHHATRVSSGFLPGSASVRQLQKAESFSGIRSPPGSRHSSGVSMSQLSLGQQPGSARKTPLGSSGRRRAWSLESKVSKSTGADGSMNAAQYPFHTIKTEECIIRNSRQVFKALHGQGMWEFWIADCLSILLATAPNLKRYVGKLRISDELETLSKIDLYDGLASCTPCANTLPWPESVAVYSRNRHRDIITKAVTDTLLFVLKCAGAGSLLQREHLAKLLYRDNAPLLIVKYLSVDPAEYLSVAELSSDIPCDRSVEDALYDAQAVADGVRHSNPAYRRRSSTTTMVTAGFSPPVTPFVTAPPSFVVACGMHGIVDASALSTPQSARSPHEKSTPHTENDVLTSPPPSPIPQAPGRGILVRATSAPADFHAFSMARSIAEDIQAELGNASPRNARKPSPTQTSRPSLELSLEDTDVVSGPATDVPVRGRLNLEFPSSVATAETPDSSMQITRKPRRSDTKSPVGDLAISAVPQFDPLHVIAAAAGLSLSELTRLNECSPRPVGATSSTNFPLHAKCCGGFASPVNGQPLSRRRVGILTNMLRILRIITKSVPERTNETLVKYNLKLLKAQVRHLGMWKRRNMAIISSIYRFVPHTSVNDSWLVTPGLQTAVDAVRNATTTVRGRSRSLPGPLTAAFARVLGNAADTATAEAATASKGYKSEAELQAALDQFLDSLFAHHSASREDDDVAAEDEEDEMLDIVTEDWVRLMV